MISDGLRASPAGRRPLAPRGPGMEHGPRRPGRRAPPPQRFSPASHARGPMLPRALVAVALLALAPVLAGCVSPGGLLSPASAAPKIDLLSAASPLWPDHENEPHPAFGWPTLTHPATGAGVPAFWKPVPMAPAVTKVTGVAHVAQAEGVKEGAGIAVFGSIALVPGEGQPSSVVDVSDP